MGDTRLVKEIQTLLAEEVEKAKVLLTTQTDAMIEVQLHDTSEKLCRVLSRSDFEQILEDADFLGSVARLLRATLDEAANKGIRSEDLQGIFMVGGTSLIPCVGKIVRQQFPPEKVFYDKPLEAVARGAASVAGGRELTDFIQHDYSIRHIEPQTGIYDFPVIVKAGSSYPSSGVLFSKNVRATYDGQIQLGIQVFEIANKDYAQSSTSLEMQTDSDGTLRLVNISAQHREEKRSVWLNEKTPTFLEANPPAKAFIDRFRVDFFVDSFKRLTISAYDLERGVWVLTNQPVVRLA